MGDCTISLVSRLTEQVALLLFSLVHSFAHLTNICCPSIMGKVIAFKELTFYKGDYPPEPRAEHNPHWEGH